MQDSRNEAMGAVDALLTRLLGSDRKNSFSFGLMREILIERLARKLDSEANGETAHAALSPNVDSALEGSENMTYKSRQKGDDMEIELIPYQTITLGGSGGSLTPNTWARPREESVDAEGYNFGILQVSIQALVPTTGSHPGGLLFAVDHAEDNLVFEEIPSSKVQTPITAGGGTINVQTPRYIAEFARYLRPRLVSFNSDPETFALRVLLKLSKR